MKLISKIYWNKFVFIIALLLCVKVSYAQTFFRSYGSGIVNEGGQAIIDSPDGCFFVGGYKGDSALLVKINALGNVVWTRTFQPAINANIFSLAITPDNFLIGVGNGLNALGERKGFLFKFDLQGNIIWCRSASDNRAIICNRIIPKTATEYTLLYTNYDISSFTAADPVAAKVNALTGALIWTSPRYDFMASNHYIDEFYSACSGKGNVVYATGRSYITGSGTTGMRPTITKLNGGILQYSKYILYNALDAKRIYGIDIIYDNDSLLLDYFGDKNSGTTANYSVGLIKSDTLGNIIWSKDYNILSSPSEFCFKALKTTYGYAIIGYTIGVSSRSFFIIATSRQGNLLWAKSYGSAVLNDLLNTTTSNAISIGGDILFTGRSENLGSKDLIVARVDSNGSIACLSSTNLNVSVTTNPTNSNNCSVTNVSDNVVYSSSPSSTAAANIPDLCSNFHLNLGNDTSICDSILLNAAMPGVNNYLWSTGSTLPSIYANKIDTFWVEVRMDCCILRDTLIISQIPNLTSHISGVTTICNGQSAILTATGGTSYLWSNGAIASSITVQPLSSSMYFVSAMNGICKTKNDTFNLTVIIGPTVHLIGDTLSCNGSPVQLIANSLGATSFLWSSPIVSTNDTVSFIPTSTSTFYVVSNNGICNSLPDSIIVYSMLSPTPSFNLIGPYCQSTLLNFTNTTPGNVNYYWNFGDPSSGLQNFSNATNPSHSFASPNSYIVSLAAQNLCGIATTTDTLVIQTGPTVSIVDSVRICNGQQTTLTASGGTSYQWSGAITSTGPSIIVNPIAQSTYIVKASNGVCFGAQDSVIVYVSPLPVVSLIGDSSICAGNSAQLVASAGGGSTIIWSSPIISSNDTVQVSPNATTTYYVSTSNGICNSLKDSIVVTVLTIPIPSFSSPTNNCFMTSISFTNATVGSSSFTWNFGDPSSGLQNFSNATNPSHSFASPNSYIVSLAVQNSCGIATTTDTLVIQTGSTVSIVDSVRICNGQQTTLTASGGTSYQWSGAITSTSPSIIVNPIAQSTYIVKASNGVCFGAPDTMIVYVSPLPFVSLIGDSSICAGNSAQLVASAAGGSIIIWSSPIISSNDTVNVSPVATTTYYVSVSNGICTSQTDSLLVKVLSVPVPAFINQSNPCSLTPISFTNTTIGSPSYLWNFGDPGSGVLNTSTLTNPSHLFSTSSTYTISLTASNTCGSISSNLPLTFLNGPNVLVDSDKTICLGDQVTLNASGGISYQWTGGITSTNSTVQVSPSVSSTYIVKAFDGNCYGKPDTVIVNPVPKPIVSIIGKNSACLGESITLVGTGASNFNWTGDIISTNSIVTFSTVNSINCMLTGSTGDCFSDPVPYNLTVSNPTTAFFTYTLDTCLGEFYFTNLSTFASNYLWNFDDGIQSQIENPIHTFDLSGDYNITLITNPGNYCTDTFQVTIPFEQIIDGLLFIPNCFTPNGDGLNDNFIINSNTTCKYLTLEIYNRWGQIIFETAGYQLKWDGRTKFGSSPDGVYVYRIQSSTFEKVGHITLLR